MLTVAHFCTWHSWHLSALPGCSQNAISEQPKFPTCRSFRFQAFARSVASPWKSGRKNARLQTQMTSAFADSDWLWLWLIFTYLHLGTGFCSTRGGSVRRKLGFWHLIVLQTFAGHQKPHRYAWWVSVPWTIAPWTTTEFHTQFPIKIIQNSSSKEQFKCICSIIQHWPALQYPVVSSIHNFAFAPSTCQA